MTRRPLTDAEQHEVSRLCVKTSLMLMQHGAESVLVESVARRLGLALGVDQVDVALMANAITVSTTCGDRAQTLVRRNEDRGINMHVVTEVQRTMLDVEAGQLQADAVGARLDAIQPMRYPRGIVAVMIGLSCACFARLAGADLAGCTLTFVAAAIAMLVRQQLAHLHFSPIVNFAITAFVATSVALQGIAYEIGAKPKLALVASVLLLVPGFPLINAVSDMVKGYINTGLSRWTMATLLSLSTCGGIILAMAAWNIWAWL